jgi:hypothetical protein
LCGIYGVAGLGIWREDLDKVSFVVKIRLVFMKSIIESLVKRSFIKKPLTHVISCGNTPEVRSPRDSPFSRIFMLL